MTFLERIKNHKKETFLVVIILFFGIGLILKLKQEEDLDYNRKLGIAKLLRITNGSNSHKWVDYQFYENGKLIETSDPLRASWPNHIREGKPVIRAFYPVEFDRENPQYSKIIITERPLKLQQVLKDHISVYGNVLLASPVSDNYVDLRIEYNYQGVDFNFRTRLHKDSLPCGNVESCKESQIKLLVSKHYPEVNDLYFKSYDRKNLLEQYKLN
ncbi:MAG: hypothetical protein KDD31_06770 [Muricauda sp.]|nr:hypothetical protein [Allomuricauda sp.]